MASALALAAAMATLVAPPSATGAPTMPAAPPPAPASDASAGGIADLPVEAPGLDPVLDGIPVHDDIETGAAERAFDADQRGQAEATLRWIDATDRRSRVVGRLVAADAGLSDARRVVTAAEATLAATRAEWRRRTLISTRRREELATQQSVLRRLAVAVFTSAPTDAIVGLGTFDDMSASNRRDAVRTGVVDDQTKLVDDLTVRWRQARGAAQAQQRRVDRARADLAAAEQRVADATSARADLDRLLGQAEREVTDRSGALDRAVVASRASLLDRRRARLTARVRGLDLDLVAVHAYWRAASLAPCAVPWWVLAGIGRVESRHGTVQGARVGADGTTTTRILGIPLDGRPGTQAIPDTDGGRLDGDTTWDRAVGPMQFIPGTWARWALDASADGEADPHDLYDAAAAAARYLCFRRGDLLAEPAIRAALLSYNRSVPYGTSVLGHGRGYRDGLDLADVPPPALTAGR